MACAKDRLTISGLRELETSFAFTWHCLQACRCTLGMALHPMQWLGKCMYFSAFRLLFGTASSTFKRNNVHESLELLGILLWVWDIATQAPMRNLAKMLHLE